MTEVREAAIHCECRKIAYRQTKDGIVISLLLHPQEVPDALATAALGTRYMAALVEIGDDEQPINRNPGAEPINPRPPSADMAAKQERIEQPSPSPNACEKPARIRTEAQRAGYLCTLPSFQRFLCEEMEPGGITWLKEDEKSTYPTHVAAAMVREYCGVQTRSDIDGNPEALARWRTLTADFDVWQKALV